MKPLITYLFIFCSVVCFAQKNFSGRAVYQSKTSFDMERFNNRDMSEQQKKRIMDRMKNMLEKTYILNFNKTASIYEEEEKLEAPGRGGGFRFGGFTGGTQYKNTISKDFLEETEFFGKNFLIKEKVELPSWEMGAETKKIGNYVCYKATMLKKTDALDWQNMRRRSRGRDKKRKDDEATKKVTEDIEMPKEVLVTAWYTPQIPVSNGPGEYWGLPGLILEVNAGNTTVLCTEVVLNPKNSIDIKEPSKGKEVTRKEYNAIVKKKMEEMQEIWKGRRGGRGRGSRR
ncbi:GLPGLI family protein [Tenacibaculum amylolyticum]|uniref:GLPGLI family protein n=1 Tax=Tenacibaculum amylolyticum TaxID=104269 RepID=UPI003894906A